LYPMITGTLILLNSKDPQRMFFFNSVKRLKEGCWEINHVSNYRGLKTNLFTDFKDKLDDLDLIIELFNNDPDYSLINDLLLPTIMNYKFLEINKRSELEDFGPEKRIRYYETLEVEVISSLSGEKVERFGLFSKEYQNEIINLINNFKNKI
jgi:hypothetical protein